MSEPSVIEVNQPEDYAQAIEQAEQALQRGEVIVLPTDTVYGIGADAFNPEAVTALLNAKGRGRHMPPPVLVANLNVLDALAVEISEGARALAEAFWPGALTIICHAQPSLAWDLGETNGTVALRMPNHPFTLALLEKTGPMAVSSANRTGYPAAITADSALEQLGDAVSVYLSTGPSTDSQTSTIVDATGIIPQVVRPGVITTAQLQEVTEVNGPPDSVK